MFIAADIFCELNGSRSSAGIHWHSWVTGDYSYKDKKLVIFIHRIIKYSAAQSIMACGDCVVATLIAEGCKDDAVLRCLH